jgi:hypothetical protein
VIVGRCPEYGASRIRLSHVPHSRPKMQATPGNIPDWSEQESVPHSGRLDEWARFLKIGSTPTSA